MLGQDLLTALADELHGMAPELVQAYDAGSAAEPENPLAPMIPM